MNKNSQVHFYVETEVLRILKLQASKEGVTLSKLCREKLREYSLFIKLQETLTEINNKISREQKILYLLEKSLKSQLNLCGRLK